MPNTPEYKQSTMLAIQKAKEDMTNSSVKEMQKKLQYYYPDLKADGLYGKKTIAAIRGFEDMMNKEPLSQQELIDKAVEVYGEDYIMKSEMQQMEEYFGLPKIKKGKGREMLIEEGMREIKNEGVRRHNKAKRKSDRIKGSY